jgi:hypothetical protein
MRIADLTFLLNRFHQALLSFEVRASFAILLRQSFIEEHFGFGTNSERACIMRASRYLAIGGFSERPSLDSSLSAKSAPTSKATRKTRR